MGRAKVSLKLMMRKSRMATFKKRKDCLTKKLQELTILCDVGACMIIYDHDEGTTSMWPPEKPDEVRRLVDAYKGCSGSIKSHGVSDFFAEKRREVEEEVLKLRKKKNSVKYPTWDDRLMFMDECQLRGLDGELELKAEIVRSRIQFLKQEFEKSVNSDFTVQFQEISPTPAFGVIDYDSAAAMDFMHCSSKENLGVCLDQNLNYYGLNGQDMISRVIDYDSAAVDFMPCSSKENLGVCLDQNLSYCGLINGDYCSSMGNLGWVDRNLNYCGLINGDYMNHCCSMENLGWMDQNLSYCGFDMNQCSSMENLGWMDQSLI